MSEYGSRPHGYYYNSLHRRSASSQHGKKLFRKSYLDAEVDLISFAYCQLRFSVSLVIGLGQLYLTLMLPVVVYGKREKKNREFWSADRFSSGFNLVPVVVRCA